MNALLSSVVRVFLLGCLSFGLILAGGANPQGLKETLLTKDNAYNPVPSPDGRYIAYVRTGWGRPGGSGGFGRSNLISEIVVVDENSAPTPASPLADMFLSGWTPDSSRLVCFRDWTYALVSTEGKRTLAGRIPNASDGFWNEEWVAYSPSLGTVLWSRQVDDSHRAIEAPGRRMTTEKMIWNERVVPSPDGRYLAVFREESQTDLRVYDLQLKVWTNLGRMTIHPDNNWWYIQPNWNPWFADGSRLVFLRGSKLVIAGPSGTQNTEIEVGEQAGLPVPSPDGQSIAYATFEPRPMTNRPDLRFWGGTTILVVSLFGGSKPRPVTLKNSDEVYDLKWLNNDALVFDRVADEVFYRQSRIWKVVIPR